MATFDTLDTYNIRKWYPVFLRIKLQYYVYTIPVRSLLRNTHQFDILYTLPYRMAMTLFRRNPIR
jgi:hypothetical protein